MEINGFNENEVSEQNKKALRSETWQKARKVMKTEVQHFTEVPEIQHFAIEKVSKNDNVYGVVWGNVVREYLKTAYSEENVQADIISDGITYKVLKREIVTAFYDADGNTLFDVENGRLEKEYEYVMQEDKTTGGLEKKNIDLEKEEASKTKHTEDEKKSSPADKTEAVKSYSSGEEKLIVEEDEMIASVKPEFKKMMRVQLDLIFKELIGWTKQDSEFDKKVLLEHKSMKRCMKFCADKAMELREPSDQEKAAARNNIPIMTPVGSDMLFGWIKEYYNKDDKAEVEKEEKRKVNKKKSKAAPKGKVNAKQSETSKKKVQKETKYDEVKSTTSKKREMENQLSVFDLMGV